MTYNNIFANSFSRHYQRKLGCWAFIGLLIIVIDVSIVFKPFIWDPAAILNLQRSMEGSLKFLMRIDENVHNEQSKLKLICNTKHPRSDVCDVDGDIRVQGKLSTVLIVSNPNKLLESNNSSWNIKPYARKQYSSAMMRRITTIAVRGAQVSEALPDCSRKYNIPAIIFSTRGFAGNFFHAFSDILIPLYSTSIQFNGESLFLATGKSSSWINQYELVLKKLSRYEIIDFDKENKVLCFPRIIVGLKASIEDLAIDSSESSYSMKDFREFLRSTYSLEKASVNYLRNEAEGKRPHIFIISRSETRRLVNVEEIANMAESLGFEVTVDEPGLNVSVVSKKINSAEVLVGVHGAGLTNMVFLPDDAVLIQIIPFGDGTLEAMAGAFYEKPTRGMNLLYLGYKISPNESSLIHQYPYDHEIFKATGQFIKKGWHTFKSTFMDNQDFEVDVSRFRKILLNALELLQKKK